MTLAKPLATVATTELESDPGGATFNRMSATAEPLFTPAMEVADATRSERTEAT